MPLPTNTSVVFTCCVQATSTINNSNKEKANAVQLDSLETNSSSSASSSSSILESFDLRNSKMRKFKLTSTIIFVQGNFNLAIILNLKFQNLVHSKTTLCNFRCLNFLICLFSSRSFESP